MSKTYPRADWAEWVDEATALAHGLAWLSNRLSARAVEAYRPLGLSAIGARIVKALGPTPSLHAAALSARIDVDPAATSRALKNLKQRGWVYEDSGRRLALTESGVQMRLAVAALSDEMFRGLTSGFSANDRKQLMTYLMRLRNNLPALSMLGNPIELHSEERG